MPASMMMPEVGSRWKVSGSSMAMVAMGPMPGRTPTSVPISAPTKAKSKFIGVMATPKPMARFWTISIGLEGGPEGDGQGEPDDEKEPAESDQHERGDRHFQKPHATSRERPDGCQKQDRQDEAEPFESKAEYHEAEGDEDGRAPRRSACDVRFRKLAAFP